jgi:hypothetical protein
MYLINQKGNSEVRLVEADNPAQALRHVVNPQYVVNSASAKAVAHAMASGVKLEVAAGKGSNA